ncbi:MAG TPA: winged helix-turn-helix domain-containing protein [Pseudolabrys sp.]|nr:winged helix-turn-helix domain-containing protein [Pseudolabrys sp.]
MIYTFEEYSLDSARRQLRRGSNVVSIEPQVFDILELLVSARPNIVTKNELIATIWDGRIVSNSTITSRISAARAAIRDNAREQRLIQTFSRRGFRFVGAVRIEQESKQTSAESSHHLLQGKLPAHFNKSSIAVLPFTNIPEDDRKHQEFVYGIVEDIRAELSQFPWLSVIARSMPNAHEGWTVDIKQSERDSIIHYVLEGSVRRDEKRLRIVTRLVDAASGAYLWARRFDLEHDDDFRVQDQITGDVLGAIAPKLEKFAIDRACRSSLEKLDPVQCYLRGLGQVYQWSRDGINNALCMFHKANELDPEFAPAYGMAAYCYVQRKSYGWIGNRQQETTECELLARKAAALVEDDALTLSKAAHAIASVVGDLDSGAIFIDQALRANPNLGAAWYVSGWIRLFLGRTKEGAEHLERAIRLSSCDPLIFKVRAGLGYAYFLAGRYDEAAALTLSALGARPGYLTAMRGAAASHALAGRLDEARRLITRMHARDPALRVSNLPDLLPFSREQDSARWTDGLRKAGLPD